MLEKVPLGPGSQWNFLSGEQSASAELPRWPPARRGVDEAGATAGAPFLARHQGKRRRRQGEAVALGHLGNAASLVPVGANGQIGPRHHHSHRRPHGQRSHIEIGRSWQTELAITSVEFCDVRRSPLRRRGGCGAGGRAARRAHSISTEPRAKPLRIGASAQMPAPAGRLCGPVAFAPPPAQVVGQADGRRAPSAARSPLEPQGTASCEDSVKMTGARCPKRRRFRLRGRGGVSRSAFAPGEARKDAT